MVTITMQACHAREITEEAFAHYGTPEIVNTDQVSQFIATEFTDGTSGCTSRLTTVQSLHALRVLAISPGMTPRDRIQVWGA